MSYTVTIKGPAPWGFRMQGGKDFNMPLTISRISPGSKAALGNLTSGDIIVAIDGSRTEGLTHLEAQNKIKAASLNLTLSMQRSKRPAPVPTATPRMDSPMPVIPHQKVVEAGGVPPIKTLPVSGPAAPFSALLSPLGKQASGLKQQYNSPIGLYSAETLEEIAVAQGVQGRVASAAGAPVGAEYVPNFNPSVLKDSALSTHKPIEVKGPGGKATIIHAQYNTPISMYSQDAIMDAIAGQAQARGNEMSGEEGQTGSPLATLPVKNRLIDSASPVYQAVINTQEKDPDLAEWARRAANLQSKSFRVLAHITGTEYMQDPDEEALRKSRERFESEVKGPRFAKLRKWHHGLSAQILNVQQ